MPNTIDHRVEPNRFDRLGRRLSGGREEGGRAPQLAELCEADLRRLRFALRRALATVPLGSPPSQLLGRLSRLTRAELRGREPKGSPAQPPRRGA